MPRPHPQPPYAPESHLALVTAANETLLELRRNSLFDLDTGAIRTAITIGDLRGRPLDISGIAGSTGIARATVKRKIKELETSGLVRVEKIEGRQIVRHSKEDQVWRDFLDTVCARILRVGDEIREAEKKVPIQSG